jgi:hypothetical protein
MILIKPGPSVRSGSSSRTLQNVRDPQRCNRTSSSSHRSTAPATRAPHLLPVCSSRAPAPVPATRPRASLPHARLTSCTSGCRCFWIRRDLATRTSPSLSLPRATGRSRLRRSARGEFNRRASRRHSLTFF